MLLIEVLVRSLSSTTPAGLRPLMLGSRRTARQVTSVSCAFVSLEQARRYAVQETPPILVEDRIEARIRASKHLPPRPAPIYLGRR